MSTSFIAPGHVRAFRAVTTQLYGEVTLMSCLINRKPGVAIVLMDHVGEGKIGVMPLFVAITDDMNVTFEGEGGDGGGAVLTGNSKPTRMRPVLRTTFRKRRAPAGPAAGALPVIDGPLTDEDSARPSPTGYCRGSQVRWTSQQCRLRAPVTEAWGRAACDVL